MIFLFKGVLGRDTNLTVIAMCSGGTINKGAEGYTRNIKVRSLASEFISSYLYFWVFFLIFFGFVSLWGLYLHIFKKLHNYLLLILIYYCEIVNAWNIYNILSKTYFRDNKNKIFTIFWFVFLLLILGSDICAYFQVFIFSLRDIQCLQRKKMPIITKGSDL